MKKICPICRKEFETYNKKTLTCGSEYCVDILRTVKKWKDLPRKSWIVSYLNQIEILIKKIKQEYGG